MDFFAVGEFLCMSAYFLLAAGILVGYLLETDTLCLTPTLPLDARKILILFSGTSRAERSPLALGSISRFLVGSLFGR